MSPESAAVDTATEELQQLLDELPLASPLRTVVAASWTRCREAGLTPVDTPPHRVPDWDLQARTARNRTLIEIAAKQLEWGSTMLTGVPHVAYLVDADGIVLFSTGSDAAIADAAGLKPGFDWSERRMGTNGAGTALVEGEPVVVVGSEHFAESFRDCTCTAAPVRDERGAVLGAVDITTGNVPGVAQRLTLVAHLADAITQELRLRSALEQAHLEAAERAATQSALRLSEERFRVALSRAPVIIAHVDTDLRYTWVFNPAPPFDPPSVIGKRDAELLPAEIAEEIATMKRQVLATGTPVKRELQFTLAGERLAYDFTAEPLRDEDGTIVGLTTVAMDITGRKHAEEEHARLHERERVSRREAEAARAAADLANRAKSEFLAKLSHEFRTPLNAALGYLELLEFGVRGALSDAQLEDVRRIKRSQHALLALVNDLLNFARVEAGKLEYRVEEFQLAELLENVEAIVARQALANSLELETSACDPVVAAKADREKTQQVLLNLLTNAIKFTPEGGRISMRCDTADAGVRVVVADTGPGIPPERLDTVFDPFVQLGVASPGRTGVGLGLSIARELARGMGGDLLAANGAGGGAEFTLILPRGGQGDQRR